jgi:hypothetical protein
MTIVCDTSCVRVEDRAELVGKDAIDLYTEVKSVWVSPA